ncbi:hypothetical protein GCM10022197_05460 [Microlunatus spumicola]|uniref:Uncharacterized protein n=1 Tax=Microlunatus spumicola TaxID=81499 RepID=A0ABP6WLD3_9ACTN
MGIQDKAEDVAGTVRDAADDATDQAKDVADDAARKARHVAEDAGDAVRDTAGRVSDRVQDAVDDVQDGHGVVNRLHKLGVRSEWAYAGAFASIGLSLASWVISRNKTGDDKSQSDRWGIFIGHWAPTFMGLGLALKQEEKR